MNPGQKSKLGKEQAQWPRKEMKQMELIWDEFILSSECFLISAESIYCGFCWTSKYIISFLQYFLFINQQSKFKMLFIVPREFLFFVKCFHFKRRIFQIIWFHTAFFNLPSFWLSSKMDGKVWWLWKLMVEQGFIYFCTYVSNRRIVMYEYLSSDSVWEHTLICFLK